jgi:hypothetical protein
MEETADGEELSHDVGRATKAAKRYAVATYLLAVS